MTDHQEPFIIHVHVYSFSLVVYAFKVVLRNTGVKMEEQALQLLLM